MVVLSAVQRSVLERVVGDGRGHVEVAAGLVLSRLGVAAKDAPGHLSDAERRLRVGLRARSRALGQDPDVAAGVSLLAAEVAYVQWHRLLFARFLEANELLMHPEFGGRVSLAECAELADSMEEPDGWGVASRFAAEILPGIFRVDDPCAQIVLATEDRLALEEIVLELPDEVLTSTDALGWVYQYWQSKAKKEVNESGRKIGGADLAPVTQLFTEDYMVRFLLENSLGAWWAGKHPESPLVKTYDFLRFDDEIGLPAAGTFEGWPATVAGVTMMDPCCGSGHFLVAGFHMLWQMRAEEEGLSLAAAQDAVLRENLFGLELDPRCTQIAMFALALEAWKSAGYRKLPVPNVACSGIPAKAPLQEWTKLADGDYKLEQALARLHALFKDADTLGSLIDPIRAAEQNALDSVDWHEVAPLLQQALTKEAAKSGDPAAEVFGHVAAGIARAADLLTGQYTLVTTNPPYLSRGSQDILLSEHCLENFAAGKSDLATAMTMRVRTLAEQKGSCLLVLPQNWLALTSYTSLRRSLLIETRMPIVARLGAGAFSSISGEVVQPSLVIVDGSQPNDSGSWMNMLDVGISVGGMAKSLALRSVEFVSLPQKNQLAHPDSRILFEDSSGAALLSELAAGIHGLGTKDSPRFIRLFWELKNLGGDWERMQSSVSGTKPWGGMENVVYWQKGQGVLHELARSGMAILAGGSAHGRPGVLVSQVGSLSCTLYFGGLFEKSAAVVALQDAALLPAVWSFCSDPEYAASVRAIDQKVAVTNKTLVKVPFDVDRWRAVAAKEYPNGLPQPVSDDPTQWLFKGTVSLSSEPLQVAVARLLGFNWPDQAPDSLDSLADNDGIVCCHAMPNELPAAERVRQILATDFGNAWSNSQLDKLIIAALGKAGSGLDAWLRDVFAKHHNKVFANRPFIWQIWDGRKDGFSALINYHRLDKTTFEKLTYTTLGWWIDKQRADADSGVTGAEARLVAAVDLQDRLKLIIEGEPPYDIFVRWKSLAAQPVGWDPDLDDGVRLNIRPFVETKVLKAMPNVNWRKDRGTNPDGAPHGPERHNDLHFTREEKLNARGAQ